jgi:hypothetical protein
MASESGIGLIGCGGGGSGSESSSVGDSPDSWTIAPLALSIGDTAIVYQLSATLPPNVSRGGTFAVDPSGKPLPAGVALSSDGVLSLTSAAVPGGTAGIVFSYAEPEA